MLNIDIIFKDESLVPVWEKIQNGQRLSLEDGLILYRSNDLISLGKMADAVKFRKSGDAVYFVLNRKIEHTNICVLSCKFCDFAKKNGETGSYEMTTEEIIAKLSDGIKEVHITGGMPADWSWERYLDIVESIHQQFPNIDVKAYTAVEIDYFHKKFKMSVEEILRQLKMAGLKTMPGGGAEIFSVRVRKELFHQKVGEKGWLDIHKTAHRMGIPTNATMLYGHIETIEERIIHLIKLREAQDETGGFLTFIPLAFQPGNTGIKLPGDHTSAVDDLKTIAISRLMLDNFPHIKAYWVMLTEEVAAVALNFGADDIDGTVGEERIAHDAGAVSPKKLAEDQIIKIITDSGKVPVERDVFYNPIKIYGKNLIGKIPYLNSVPFYNYLNNDSFKIIPINPRRLGQLFKREEIEAGLISLMDYFDQEDNLDLLNWCIAAGEKVKSVLLFSKFDWNDLQDKKIGIVDDTSTSVKLLQVLLLKKYRVTTEFERMIQHETDYNIYDAVLMIGDEALSHMKTGLPGFEKVYDLAQEWYNWQKLPFVFAVWVVNKKFTNRDKFIDEIKKSLSKGLNNLEMIGKQHGEELGLSITETKEYLEGFNYELGENEKEAIKVFKNFVLKIEMINDSN